jgi:hypothetical protein
MYNIHKVISRQVEISFLIMFLYLTTQTIHYPSDNDKQAAQVVLRAVKMIKMSKVVIL